jgi:hypothetical protein
MRTGRLSISRGHQLAGASDGPVPPQLTLVPAQPAPEPVSPDYHAVHDRLTSLERLTRLFELGAMSAEEFAAEKAPVHFVPAAPQRIRSRGPSLVGRMLNWKFLVFSLIVGLGLSFAAQPNETQRFLDQMLRLAGV